MRARRATAVAAITAGAMVLGGLGAAPALAKKPKPKPAPKPTACSTLSAFTSKTQKVSTDPEVGGIQRLLPYVDAWQRAVAKKDVAAATKAGINYELHWQGIEVYVNHRSLVLYTNTETDTQFVLDADLEADPVDWTASCALVKHLGEDIDTAIALSKAGPKLSPIFDDLAKVRAVRANLNQARDFLTAGDLATAKTYIAAFSAGWPAVESLISARSTRAVQDIHDTKTALDAAIADPAATATSVNTPFLTFQSRVGFGVNTLNAAARASDPHRAVTGFTDNDKTNLANLGAVWANLIASESKIGTDPAGAAAGGATGPGSAFAKVEPALEVQVRYISVAPALRTALNAYSALVGAATAPSQAAVASAVAAVADQIEIDQQDLVGQFWSDPSVRAAGVANLPTS